jgi:hypothetical protein
LVQVVLADAFISRNMVRRAGHSWYLSLGAGFFSLGFIVSTTSSKTNMHHVYSTTYIYEE